MAGTVKKYIYILIKYNRFKNLILKILRKQQPSCKHSQEYIDEKKIYKLEKSNHRDKEG